MLPTSIIACFVLASGAPEAPARAAGAADALAQSALLSYTYDPADVSVAMNLSVQQGEGGEAAQGRRESDVEEAGSQPRPLKPAYGEKGTTRWRIQFARGVQFSENTNKFFLGGFGLSHFIARGVSLDLEFNGMYYDQEGQDASGFDFNLLFRWHFLMRRRWSLYVDGGAGAQITVNEVPENGSEFNFNPQAGAGFTFDIGNDTRLMAGVRWHHVSNANLFSNNPGRDSLMAYVAVSFPF